MKFAKPVNQKVNNSETNTSHRFVRICANQNKLYEDYIEYDDSVAGEQS